MAITNEQYIEHEVKLRVMKEVTGQNFKVHEERFERMELKMNWIIGLVVGGWILPIVLHYLKLV